MNIQWLGHSAFKLTGGGASVLIDPFLTGNPKFSGELASISQGVSHVLLTHAHNDHFGDTLEIMAQTGAVLVAMPEICGYVQSALSGAKCAPINIGGPVDLGPIKVAMVQAFHSSSYKTPDGQLIYGGMPAGLVVSIDGQIVYHMGDTGIFSDMALIDELHRPDIGIVPIGGNYTMDAGQAALAVNRFFHFKTVIPCHYLTFPGLAESADGFIEAVKNSEVWAPAPMASRDF